MAALPWRYPYFLRFVRRPHLNSNSLSTIPRAFLLATPLLLSSLPFWRRTSKNPFVIRANDTPTEVTGLTSSSSSIPSSSSSSPNEIKRRKKEEARRKRLIDLVDAKNSQEDHQSARRLLLDFKAEETEDPRLLWRFSRTLYELSSSSSPPVDEERLLGDALLYAERAVSATTSAEAEDRIVGGANAETAAQAHLWYAIVLEALGRWKSLRERIADTFVIKDHYLKSLQSKPQNAIVLHCLGSWCFTVASLSWFERKFAQLKNEAKAQEYLERVVNFTPLTSDEDTNAVKEARRLLLIDD